MTISAQRQAAEPRADSAAARCRPGWPVAPAVLVLLLLGMPVLAAASPPLHGGALVDEVRVIKHERKLYLLSGDRILRQYRVSLGGSPKGHKLRSGDNRTPEGRFELDWRNENSDFHRSIHVSYPRPQDRQWARMRGVDPGRHIMIHGLPNGAGDNGAVFDGVDWTDGCIAVNDNTAMDEIWELVGDGTPIVILP